MKLVFGLLVLMMAVEVRAAASSLKLSCVVFDRRCDANGEIVGEKYEVKGVSKPGEKVVTVESVTKDGRFTVRGVAGTFGSNKVKTGVWLYDSKTRSGVAAGSLAIDQPASYRSDLTYVYGVDSIDDGKDLFCHSVEATCELK